MIFIAVLIVNLVSAIGYFTVARLSAMQSTRWIVIGSVFGVFVLPLFVIQRHMRWRQSVGYGNRILAA